ncbi:MAG: hypothetical protein LBC27_04640 [Spirochaetaceae bacterium]|nr:hypothetical protein [Spirochaetaceae bacterium]
MKKKKSRFFCDGCGTEVSAETERCPRCGKFFASIRCPACGFTGDTAAFSKGCPSCGYSARKRPSKALPPQSDTAPQWFYAVTVALLVLLLATLLMYVIR